MSSLRAIFRITHTVNAQLLADSLLVGGGVDVGEPALAAVLPVEVGSHEDAGAALLAGALPAGEQSRMSHDSGFKLIILHNHVTCIFGTLGSMTELMLPTVFGISGH